MRIPIIRHWLKRKQKNVEAGITKYFNGHRLKVQGGIIYSKLTDMGTNAHYDGYWSAVFQIELGI